MRVEWTRRALRSLDDIASFIARDDPDRAISFTHELFERIDHLAQFPYMGRPSERADVREFVLHKHYLVSYRLRPGRIEILDIWHSAQLRLG